MIARFVVGLAAGATAAFLVRGRAASPANGRPNSNHNNRTDPANGVDSINGEMRQLVGIITHELRNPTSVILGYQELLAAGLLGPVNERALEALERIRRAAGQLRDLTDGLQILTDDTPERHHADKTVNDLGLTATRCLDAALPDAQARNVQLSVDADADVTIVGDPDSVERLLDLIIAAALRTAPDTAVQLVLRTDNDHATLHATGALFDPAAHSPALLSPPQLIDSGLALRLAIAQRIARQLGGHLTVDPAGLLSLRLPRSAR